MTAANDGEYDDVLEHGTDQGASTYTRNDACRTEACGANGG